MTQFLPPETIKTIARHIRDLEEDRLGTRLPNTTVLNGITRALGLGSSFSMHASNTKPSAPAALPEDPVETPGAAAIFILEGKAWKDDDLPGAEKSLSGCLPEDWTIEIMPAAHGRQLVMALNSTITGSTHDRRTVVVTETRPLLDCLDRHAASGDIPQVIGALIDAEDRGQRLHVNFRYADTGQICTGDVSRAFWQSRYTQSFDRVFPLLEDEDLFLASFFNIEIEPEYTAQDIVIEDVFSLMERDDADHHRLTPDWSEEEKDAIRSLATRADILPETVLRQALRYYQQAMTRLDAGESCHWSGDTARARAFAGEASPSAE